MLSNGVKLNFKTNKPFTYKVLVVPFRLKRFAAEGRQHRQGSTRIHSSAVHPSAVPNPVMAPKRRAAADGPHGSMAPKRIRKPAAAFDEGPDHYVTHTPPELNPEPEDNPDLLAQNLSQDSALTLCIQCGLSHPEGGPCLIGMCGLNHPYSEWIKPHSEWNRESILRPHLLMLNMALAKNKMVRCDDIIMRDPSRATVLQLKALLRTFKWSVGGKKAELIERMGHLASIVDKLAAEGY